MASRGDMRTKSLTSTEPYNGKLGDEESSDKGATAKVLRPWSLEALQSTVVGKWALTLVLGAVMMAVSSGLILLNKHLLSEDGFAYPMCLASLGMAFSAVASFICCRVIKVVEAKRSMTWQFYAMRIMPVGLFMALTLHFGNLVYLYLTTSFIQMLKAFTPIVTMVALFVAQLEMPSRRLISAVLLIAGGTAMASYGEMNLSILGLLFMFLSETFEATRLVMTQILLTGLKFHPIEGLMYLAPACFAWLMLGVAVVEWPKIKAANALMLIYNKPGLYMSAAAMGFGVNSLAYILIQISSALTLKVLGTAKNAIVVWICVVFLGETVTLLQGVGYALSLGGFFLYNYLKVNEPAKPVYVAVPTKDDDDAEANSRKQ